MTSVRQRLKSGYAKRQVRAATVSVPKKWVRYTPQTP